jgi:hypothetical protein
VCGRLLCSTVPTVPPVCHDQSPRQPDSLDAWGCAGSSPESRYLIRRSRSDWGTSPNGYSSPIFERRSATCVLGEVGVIFASRQEGRGNAQPIRAVVTPGGLSTGHGEEAWRGSVMLDRTADTLSVLDRAPRSQLLTSYPLSSQPRTSSIAALWIVRSSHWCARSTRAWHRCLSLA